MKRKTKNDIDFYFSQNLRRLCQNKGVEQKELANGIGVSEATISRLLNDSTTATLPYILKISEYFGTATTELTEPHSVSNAEWLRDLPINKAVEVVKKMPCGYCKLNGNCLKVKTNKCAEELALWLKEKHVY